MAHQNVISDVELFDQQMVQIGHHGIVCVHWIMGAGAMVAQIQQQRIHMRDASDFLCDSAPIEARPKEPMHDEHWRRLDGLWRA